MEKSKSTEAAVVIGALLAGVAIGAAIGVLFAPEKGSDTRKKLASEGLSDDLTDKFNNMMETFKSEFDAAKGKLAEAGSKVSEKATEVKESVGKA